MPRLASALRRSAVLGVTSALLVAPLGWATEAVERIDQHPIVIAQPLMPGARAAETPGMVPASTSAQELMRIKVGSSEILKTDRTVATAIVGDESVADVTATEDGLIILWGRGIGTSNIILLDDEENEILNTTVQVTSLNEAARLVEVRLVKKTQEFTYTCGLGMQLCDKGSAGINVASSCANPGDFAADGTPCGPTAAPPRPAAVEAPPQQEAVQ